MPIRHLSGFPPEAEEVITENQEEAVKLIEEPPGPMLGYPTLEVMTAQLQRSPEDIKQIITYMKLAESGGEGEKIKAMAELLNNIFTPQEVESARASFAFDYPISSREAAESVGYELLPDKTEKEIEENIARWD